jgi:large subunit ribosomal protein L10
MNRQQKAAVIDEIAAEISASQAIFAVDYRGISVAQADQLRASLRHADAVFRVVKNSLTERAAQQAGAEQLLELLQGPTALTFVRGDAAAAAKAVADFTRTTQLLAFKGGVMDGASLSSGDVTAISRLPSREVLYGQLVGMIASPLAGLARTLNALIGGLAVGLGGVLAQKEADPAFAVAAPPAAPAAAEPEADAEPAAAEADAEPEAEAGEEPVAEEPAAQEPVAGEPAAEEPLAEEPAGETLAEEVAAEDPVVQEEPLKDSGDALTEATQTDAETEAAPAAGDPATEIEAEAAPAADGETEGAAPEARSGDDDKEDQ